ncbi:MAG: hypothetical protein JXA92_07640 [candidate division Zixibacteria bacterium]|nr:hypothetical protein [candidate division Zixibacteria bacterium]
MVIRKHLLYLIFSLLIFVNLNVHVQSQHVHPQTDDILPMTRVLVEYQPRYSIKAEIFPRTLTVKGKVELHYRNLSDDTLTCVYFDLGYNSYSPGELPALSSLTVDSNSVDLMRRLEHGYCRVDTLLYNVAPLKRSPVMLDSSLMQVFLPAPLVPGEEGFFIFVFETRLTGIESIIDPIKKPVLFDRWHPRICLYNNGYWSIEKNKFSGTRPYDYGLYRVGLQVDSAYTVIGAGYFLNEKEHYGFVLPIRDEAVYVDILNRSFEAQPGKVYKPVFEKGYKKYYWRTQGVTAFPFVLGRKFIEDRSQTDGTLIRAVYRPEQAGLWQGYAAFTAGQIISRYREKLVAFPYRELIIISGNEKSEPVGSETFIVIPDDIDNPDLLYVHLAVSLARCWLPETMTDNLTDDKFREALAVFSAWDLLYEQYDAEGYRLAEIYEKVIRERFFEENDLKTYEHVFKNLPARLYMLCYLTGDKTWSESLRRFVDDNKYQVASLERFYRAVNTDRENNLDWFFEVWLQPDAFGEFRFEGKVKSERVAGGVKVSGTIINENKLILPLEIAFLVSRVDTLYDTLRRDTFREGVAGFSKVLPEEPLAVILDPRHCLYDINRGNNYCFFKPVRFRYYPPTDLYPAFCESR